MQDNMFFVVLPYVAFFSMIFFSIARFRTNPFSYSSLSSQLVEGRQLFWGSNPWHYGLLIVLGGHIIGFFIPKTVLAINAVPLRLLLIQITGLTGGFLLTFGFIMLIYRRITRAKVRVATSTMDVVLLAVLAIQIFTGMYTAIFFRWGTSWYAAAMVPYLRSLFVFQPEIGYVVGLPLIAKLHIINAFVIMGVLPFTRLVHLWSVPFQYLSRPNQVVIWNYNRKTIRK